MENRIQVKVLSKKADGNQKGAEKFAALTKKFQEERLQCETREAYLALVEKQEKILTEEAAKLR